MAKEKKPRKVEIVNRKAKFEYQFLSEFEAGMMLTGTENKSIREGNANLSDAYCVFDKSGALYVRSMFIAEYKFGNQNNHETRRTRKLLLRKKELKKYKIVIKKTIKYILWFFLLLLIFCFF